MAGADAPETFLSATIFLGDKAMTARLTRQVESSRRQRSLARAQKRRGLHLEALENRVVMDYASAVLHLRMAVVADPTAKELRELLADTEAKLKKK